MQSHGNDIDDDGISNTGHTTVVCLPFFEFPTTEDCPPWFTTLRARDTDWTTDDIRTWLDTLQATVDCQPHDCYYGVRIGASQQYGNTPATFCETLNESRLHAPDTMGSVTGTGTCFWETETGWWFLEATANTHQPYEFAVTYGVLRVGQPIEYDRFRPPFTTVTDAWAPEQLAWPAHRLVLDGGHRGPPVEAGPAETDFTPSPASPTDEPRLAVTGTNPVAGVPIEESTRGDPPQLRSLYQSLSAVSHLAYERDQHANKTPYQVDQLVVLQPPTRSSVVVSGTVERARPRS
jgi:hypothetical protein